MILVKVRWLVIAAPAAIEHQGHQSHADQNYSETPVTNAAWETDGASAGLDPQAPGPSYIFEKYRVPWDIKCQSQSFANKMPAPLLPQVKIHAHFGRGRLIATLSS